ncbi:hypothetical protein EL22_29050 [Halostagnicola sp. A56]|nr:hypothetical protein EL22_29050 [Halostagnicola sp. A56]
MQRDLEIIPSCIVPDIRRIVADIDIAVFKRVEFTLDCHITFLVQPDLERCPVNTQLIERRELFVETRYRRLS